MTNRKTQSQEMDLSKLIRGSLIERTTRCGNRNCRCQRGQRHGPYFYLSVTLAVGKTKTYYVPGNKVEQVREGIESYQRAVHLLKHSAEANRRTLGIGGA